LSDGENHLSSSLTDVRRDENGVYREVAWAVIENDTLSILSRHGGKGHTNSISLDALLSLLRGTHAHANAMGIIKRSQEEAGTKILADTEIRQSAKD